jgi:hypothetical protein
MLDYIGSVEYTNAKMNTSKRLFEEESIEGGLQTKRVRFVEEREEKMKKKAREVINSVLGKKQSKKDVEPPRAAEPLPVVRVEIPTYVSDEVEVTLEFLQKVVKLPKIVAEKSFPVLQECGYLIVGLLVGIATKEELNEQVRVVDDDTQKVKKKLLPGAVTGLWQFIRAHHCKGFSLGER